MKDGAEQAQQTIRHDLRAYALRVKELSTWIAEDIEETGMTLPETVQDALDLMDETSVSLERFTQDLDLYLRASQMGAGQSSLQAAVASCLGERLPNNALQLETDIAADTVPIPAEGLDILLDCALGNALHHSGQTPVKVWLRSALREDRLHISIEDDGTGIPEDRRDFVFRFGGRLHSGQHRTGAGLATLRQLCRNLGGDAAFQNPNHGAGARLVVTLPA